jgi:IstB-like ATP binding protein
MTPTARTPETTRTLAVDTESPSAAASRYQQLRSHLAELKLHAAAEALPSVLDQATAEGLSLTVALERLLAAEVDASTARRLAGRLRFACLPTPATLADFNVDAAAGIDRNLIDELCPGACCGSSARVGFRRAARSRFPCSSRRRGRDDREALAPRRRPAVARSASVPA